MPRTRRTVLRRKRRAHVNHSLAIWFPGDMLIINHATRALALVVLLPATAFAADAPAAHVRGTVTAATRARLTVGSARIAIDGHTKVVGVVPATMADVTAGTFIGAANVPGTGPARALEVVVFPKNMAGTGEGDYPWDLPAGGGKKSAMTNGTVGGGHTSMMTNATVRSMTAGAKTVTLSYKGGTKIMSIPDNVPIVRVVPATSALLVKGAHVVIFPGKTSTAPAPFVIVGEQGVTPPM